MERLSTNQLIGDYTVTAFLGAGGMGEVYQGVHNKLGRYAAIKVLSKVSPNSALITRFFNEARVQSSIHHPNIATLYDFQEIQGKLYIFMEFVNGESLDAMVARRAFAVEDALKTFQSICEAVAFIHERGIIHRDIKSQNIKLTSEGVVKLLDFGIAKDAGSQHLTRTGGVIGTPRYLAPEQLNGQPASRQTDIWALGILLYEMLTGVEPFRSDSMGLLYKQINEARFEKPEKLNPAIPPNVSQIVAGCLNVNPTERYSSVEELLEDLRRVLRGEKKLAGGKKKPWFSKRDEGLIGGNSNAIDNERSLDSIGSPRRISPLIAIAVGASAAVLLLFFLVGIAIWAMSDPGSGNTANNSAILISNKKTPVQPNGNGGISPQPNSGEKANKIRIDLFDGAAKVFRGGQQIGVTPFDLEAGNGEKVELTLKRDGYEDKQVQFDVSPGQKVYTFTLKPK